MIKTGKENIAYVNASLVAGFMNHTPADINSISSFSIMIISHIFGYLKISVNYMHSIYQFHLKAIRMRYSTILKFTNSVKKNHLVSMLQSYCSF